MHRWFKDQRQASFNSRRTAAAAAAAAANSIPGTSRGTALSRPAAAALGSKLGVAALQRRLLITLLTAVFYFYPSLLTSILSLFACYHLDDRSTNAAAYIGNAQVSKFCFCAVMGLSPSEIMLIHRIIRWWSFYAGRRHDANLASQSPHSWST